jgi:hypothetical protein
MRILPLLLLAACGAEQLEPVEPDGFLVTDVLAPPTTGGCFDVLLYARNPNDTRAIFVNISGLASDAHRSPTGTVSGNVTLPAGLGTASVRGEEGTDLTSASCVGAFPFPGPQVNTTWDVVSGRLRYTATALPGGGSFMPLAEVDATLRNVVLSDGAGQTITIPRLQWTSVTAGFFPP